MLPGVIWTSGGNNINAARGPGYAYLAQVVGEVSIKGQPVMPFRIYGVKGLVSQRDHMLSK